MNRLTFALLFAAALATGTTFDARAQKADAKKDLKDPVVVLDDVKSKVPENWVREKPANLLRSYQFRVPKAKEDAADAEVAILPDVRGTPEDNVKRWKKMFEPPDGKTIDEVSKIEKLKVGKAAVTVLDIQGTYLYKERPQAPDSTAIPKPNYRMVAVIFETKEGSHFIRLIGPEKTVAQHKKGFDEWLKAFK